MRVLFAFVVLVYTGFQELHKGIYSEFEMVSAQSRLE